MYFYGNDLEHFGGDEALTALTASAGPASFRLASDRPREQNFFRLLRCDSLHSIVCKPQARDAYCSLASAGRLI